MPVYKDKERGTWYVSVYYTTWDGRRLKKHKRGFSTRKDAQLYEMEFLSMKQSSMTMHLKDFVEIYFRDKTFELKERSIRNKKQMIQNHILPYFGDIPMQDIKPSDIIQWQNVMSEKGYQATYLRMIQNQLTALFNHAERIYDLKMNPCKKVRKMGKSDANTMEFWTKDEYERFIATIERDSYYYTFFEILYWCGCRMGETLALTKNDIDLNNRIISINKTFHRSEGKDIITTPKTENSIRTIHIPEFLADELEEYINKTYDLKKDDRVFPVAERAVQHFFKRHIEKAGVKRIRVHDLRHSHVAYLINAGVDPLLIKERLGHKDIKITLNTYGHLYPSKQKAVVDLLESARQ